MQMPRLMLRWGLITALPLVCAQCGSPPEDPTPQTDANRPADPADGNADGSDPNDSPILPAAAVFLEDAEPAMAGLAHVPDELLLQTLPAADADALHATFSAAGATLLESWPELDTAVLRVTNGDLQAAAEALGRDPQVEAIQKSYFYEPDSTPDDPEFASQNYLSVVNLPQAWATTTGSESVVLAVIDTGVSTGHDDLSGKALAGRSVVTNTAGVEDRVGHGTAVAGIAAAASNNGVGIAGVSWDSPILPVVVVDDSGRGTTRHIAKGMVWAVQHQARVINVSFAPLQADRTVLRAAQLVRARGGLTFISAGNDGTTYTTPKNNAALFVGALNADAQRASFSSAGPFVDLTAPGTGIRAPALDGGYSGVSGTSFASPIVAGTAALVWSIRPDLRPATVADLLLSTARDIGPVGRDDEYGEGVLDAQAAVAAAEALLEQDDRSPPVVSITHPANNATVSGVLRIAAQATDAGDIADVTLLVDGQVRASDLFRPYLFAVTTATLAPGSHTISCVATDACGNASRPADITVFVAQTGGDGGGTADAQPPVVIITHPTDATLVASLVGIGATATDNAGLARVEWLVNGISRSSQTISGTRAEVSFLWDASSVASGNHRVTARVTDSAGNQATATVRLIRQ